MTTTIGPIHQPGMFNIEIFSGQRWRGGMNRGTREDAISTAKKWAAEDGARYRVFSPEGELVFDTETAQPVDVLAKIRAACDSDALPYAVYVAVADLIAAAELANKAGRLNTHSGSERSDVAEALGLQRNASLHVILLEAGDRLTDAILAAKGDAATLERRARNSAIVAGLLKP